MRLFVAVTFDETTKSRLTAVQNRIKTQSVRGNFSRPENFHLTLVFIGEVTPGLVPAVIAIVNDAIPPNEVQVFSLCFSRAGCFRHSGKELWWIGPDTANDSEAHTGINVLAGVRQLIGNSLDAAGIHYDRRPFRVHVTLGREIKSSAPIVLDAGTIMAPITRISLMQSENIKGRLVYTEIFGHEL